MTPETLGLYQWNEDTCGALFRASLSVVEIAAQPVPQGSGSSLRFDGQCWLVTGGTTTSPACPGHSRQKVQEITHRRHHQQWLPRVPARSPDDVVSKLTFGFWPHLSLDVQADQTTRHWTGGQFWTSSPGHRQRQSTYWAKRSPRDAFARLDLCNDSQSDRSP